MIVSYQHLLGVPFKYGGRDCCGLDCFGLLIQIYKLFNIQIPDHESTSDIQLIDEWIKIFSNKWQKIDRPEIPSAVVFWIINVCYASHVGVVIDNDKFIHIRENISVCIERLSNPVWNKRIIGFYRWNNAN